jgi:sugar phosphate permease
MVVLVMSAVIFVVLIPLYLWKVDETPARHGASAETIDPPFVGAPATRRSLATSPGEPSFGQLLRAPAFWTVVFAQVLIGGVDHAMDEHLPLFLARDAALGPTMAAWGFSLTLVAGALGKLGFGWFFDRHSLRGISLSWVLLATGIALAFPVAGLATFMLFTLVRGVTHGAALVEIPISAKHAFGTRALSKTIAMFVAANALGGAIAAGAVGFAHDVFGSYIPAFIGLIAASITAAALLLTVKSTYWVRADKPRQVKPLAVSLPADR